MSLSRDSRQERKLKFLLRKQFEVRKGLERIDYEEDVVLPQIEALKSGKSVPLLGLESGSAFEIVVEDANHHQTKADTEPAKHKRRKR